MGTATRSPLSVIGVVSPLEDALDLVIRLRGSDKPPSDADLVKLRKNIEEALSAFEDLWESRGFSTIYAKARFPHHGCHRTLRLSTVTHCNRRSATASLCYLFNFRPDQRDAQVYEKAADCTAAD
jgi:hypothetical protein